MATVKITYGNRTQHENSDESVTETATYRGVYNDEYFTLRGVVLTDETFAWTLGFGAEGLINSDTDPRPVYASGILTAIESFEQAKVAA